MQLGRVVPKKARRFIGAYFAPGPVNKAQGPKCVCGNTMGHDSNQCAACYDRDNPTAGQIELKAAVIVLDALATGIYHEDFFDYAPPPFEVE